MLIAMQVTWAKQPFQWQLGTHILYKKEDVVWLPMRQLSTRDQNDTDINNYHVVGYRIEHFNIKPLVSCIHMCVLESIINPAVYTLLRDLTHHTHFDNFSADKFDKFCRKVNIVTIWGGWCLATLKF